MKYNVVGSGALLRISVLYRDCLLRSRATILLFSVLAALPVFPAAAMASDWQLAIDRDDIQVWKRKEPGSDVMAFRAETTVASSLSGLMTLFYDIDAAPLWLDHTRRVVVLQRDDAQRRYTLLIETKLPWPLKDRDAVIVGSWIQDPQSKAIHLRGKSASAGIRAENDDFIRYRELRSDWSFIPAGKGMVKVVMEGHGDPSGSLPAFAVNMLIQESPFTTLRNLRRIIAQEKYQQSRMPDIEE